jgi:glycosyltransferase involved in cell wall biosynthesis
LDEVFHIEPKLLLLREFPAVGAPASERRPVSFSAPMKVLLYSHVFYPSTGGIETVSMELAQGFVKSGIECKVLTRTPRDPDLALDFELIDNPGKRRIKELVRWADVILFNGASPALQPWVFLYRKPFVWVHVGYQASCIDGAGWTCGDQAPTTPLASVRHHAALHGPLQAARGAVKLALRRFVAKRLAARNVAITDWMLNANPLPRQVRIYNPFPVDRFARAARGAAPDAKFDFVYMGRLVSEKGVDVLLHALAKVAVQNPRCQPKLLVVGDGDRRSELEALAERLGITHLTRFAGMYRGEELVRQVSQARIGVIPSIWHEPMGGVVVELMAAGRSLIVSERGGLSECLGDAGLKFPNGDVSALAERMTELMHDTRMQQELAEKAQTRALEFAPSNLVEQYVSLLCEVTGKDVPPGQRAGAPSKAGAGDVDGRSIPRPACPNKGTIFFSGAPTAHPSS